MSINYSLQDLIEKCKSRKRKRNLEELKLSYLLKPLEKLDNMIGMANVKQSIVDQILYYIQNLDDADMLHTIIEGPPGCGKTTVGQILGEIYCCLGIIKTSKFVIAKRSDLIGEYLGQTSIKTQKVIDSAIGGVLFIDEAYSLGNSRKTDSFSKECIDTINQNLSEKAGEFVCIIAGYKDDLDSCFFAYNPGLRRRFPWKYTITKYSSDELRLIFIKQVLENGWKLDNKNVGNRKWFESNNKYFINQGGDILTFFSKCKIMHSRRVFGLPHHKKKKLTLDDLNSALEEFKKHSKHNFDDENNDDKYKISNLMMYM
jgi:SpoVK/Ycf46/Vps4 family AAA+-type ATPase